MENLFFDPKRLEYLGVGAIVGRTVRIRRPEQVYAGDGIIIDDFTYISCSAGIGSYVHICANVTNNGGRVTSGWATLPESPLRAQSTLLRPTTSMPV